MAPHSTSSAVMAPPAVTVLGRITIRSEDGSPVEPPGARSKALVVALALAGNTGASVARLVDDLWGEETPRDARAALQALVSRLRRHSAEGSILSTAAGYALGPGLDTDLDEAERLRIESTHLLGAGDPHAAAEAAGRALAHWDGPVADLPDGDLLHELRARAQKLHEELQRLRGRALIDAGRPEDALADLEQLTAAHPLDESLTASHMRALAASGRTTDALALFAALRTRLRDEFGSDPSSEVVELNTSLLRQDATPSAPVAERRKRRRIGLRTAPNALLGRDDDLSAIEEIMARSRLTTLLGPGGLGKTRLAQEIGRRAADDGVGETGTTSGGGQAEASVPDVVVVELAGVRSGDDMTLALASTLGVREASAGRLSLNDPIVRVTVREHILATLSEHPTVLIVDNCEHIIDAAAAWVEDILASLPQVRVLATSRAPLAIGAEAVYPVEPLPGTADGAEYGPAVALFLERARAARPAAVLPIDAVARLCDRVDGLPLAIELAAARIRSMPVEEIERRLSNRFALLTGGERAAPRRHRTLLAVIDWSWNLLGDDERVLLRRLSRFPDGFSAEAAQAVGSVDGADVTDALDGLVNQSLVSAAESASTGLMRYRMLETVREFGEMALVDAGDDEAVDAGMVAWAENYCARMLDAIDVADHNGFREVAEEQENLVTVLRRAIETGRSDVTATVFALLAYFWMIRGAHSDLGAFGPSVAASLLHYDPDDHHRDATLLSLGFLSALVIFGSTRQGLLAIGRLRRLHNAQPARDPELRVIISLVLAMITSPGDVAPLLQRYRSDPAPRIAALSLLMSAQLEENSGRIGEAIASAVRAHELGTSAGSVWLPATAAQALTELHSQSDQPAEAITWATRAREGFNDLQASSDLLQLDWLTAMSQVRLGRLDEARAVFEGFLREEETDDPELDYQDRHGIALAGLAEIALASSRPEEGLRRYREAVESFGTQTARRSPWNLTIASAAVTVHVLAGRADEAWLPGTVRMLRQRMLLFARIRAGQNDLPVTGAVVRGIAVWLGLGDRGASDAVAGMGMRLLLLSDRVEARQDLPALRSDTAMAAACERAGDRVEAERLATEALTPSAAYDMIIELLRSRPLRHTIAGL